MKSFACERPHHQPTRIFSCISGGSLYIFRWYHHTPWDLRNVFTSFCVDETEAGRNTGIMLTPRRIDRMIERQNVTAIILDILPVINLTLPIFQAASSPTSNAYWRRYKYQLRYQYFSVSCFVGCGNRKCHHNAFRHWNILIIFFLINKVSSMSFIYAVILLLLKLSRRTDFMSICVKYSIFSLVWSAISY